MDPTACFQRFMEAMDDGLYDVAQAAAGDLASWIGKGGHVPELYPRDWAALAYYLQELAIRNQGD